MLDIYCDYIWIFSIITVTWCVKMKKRLKTKQGKGAESNTN